MNADDARSLLEHELGVAEERLRGLRHEFDGIVEATLDANSDDEHDPEGATIAFERSAVSSLIDQAETQIAELQQALARVEAGKYGVCEACGKPIPEARLEARPVARTCVPCASRG